MKKQIPTTLGILIILILAGVVGASVLLLSQEDEEIILPKEDVFEKDEMAKDSFEDWEIYRNEKFNFELRYPVNWNVQIHPWITEKLKEDEWHVIIEPRHIEGSMESPSIWFSNYYIPLPGTEINHGATEFFEEGILPIGHMVIKKSIGGREIFSQCSLYLHNEYGFSQKEIIGLCNKILSTFRFLD